MKSEKEVEEGGGGGRSWRKEKEVEEGEGGEDKEGEGRTREALRLMGLLIYMNSGYARVISLSGAAIECPQQVCHNYLPLTVNG